MCTNTARLLYETQTARPGLNALVQMLWQWQCWNKLNRHPGGKGKTDKKRSKILIKIITIECHREANRGKESKRKEKNSAKHCWQLLHRQVKHNCVHRSQITSVQTVRGYVVWNFLFVLLAPRVARNQNIDQMNQPPAMLRGTVLKVTPVFHSQNCP